MSEHFMLGNEDGCLVIRPVDTNKRAEAPPGYTPDYFKCDKGGKNPVTESAPSERVTPSLAMHKGDLIDQLARIVDDRIERSNDYYDNLASTIVKQLDYELDTILKRLDDFDYIIRNIQNLSLDDLLELKLIRALDLEQRKQAFSREKDAMELRDKQFRLELESIVEKYLRTIRK